jgi:membrane protease subunit HflK
MTMPENNTSPSSPRRGTPRPGALRSAFGRLLQGRDGGPPDLDEMWRDFKRKLAGFFGLARKGDPAPGGGGFQPDVKSAGIGAGLILSIIVVVWLFSGSFIVREGQQAVVTFFGKYARTVDAGWGWRLPYPFEEHEIVPVTQLQTAEIGRSTINSATGLRDSAMLTQDENIVDVRFNVQYRLKDARAFLFENNAPHDAVIAAAESAVREIVGRSRIDSVLYEQRDALAANLIKLIQAQLDRLDTGILIATVNIESVTVPDQVIQAFNEVVKANADRDRSKNEGQAYANDVIPKAQGDAAHLREEAIAYRTRVIDAAEGDADRFKAVLAEYQKAPGVTRDRLYIDTMQEVYSNVTKVLVDTRGGSNLISLPIDKLTAAAATAAAGGGQVVQSSSVSTSTVATPVDTSSQSVDARSRDNARSRDREGR